MFDLHTELAGTGMVIDDQSFFEYFTNSLPSSLDLFITLYEDNSYDVDLLCDRFAKYEMRRKLADAKDGKAGGTLDGSPALFGQSASLPSKGKGKERKKRDLRNITCYGCGKKGHVKAKCPDGEKEEKTEKKDDKSKPAKEKEEVSTSKTLSGTLYTAVSHSSLASTGDSTNMFYVDSGASYHLIPS